MIKPGKKLKVLWISQISMGGLGFRIGFGFGFAPVGDVYNPPTPHFSSDLTISVIPNKTKKIASRSYLSVIQELGLCVLK